MTVKTQILNMVELVPERELPIILEVVRRFVPTDTDDIATPDDIAACQQAMKEYRAGQTISHNDIDWE